MKSTSAKHDKLSHPNELNKLEDLSKLKSIIQSEDLPDSIKMRARILYNVLIDVPIQTVTARYGIGQHLYYTIRSLYLRGGVDYAVFPSAGYNHRVKLRSQDKSMITHLKNSKSFQMRARGYVLEALASNTPCESYYCVRHDLSLSHGAAQLISHVYNTYAPEALLTLSSAELTLVQSITPELIPLIDSVVTTLGIRELRNIQALVDNLRECHDVWIRRSVLATYVRTELLPKLEASPKSPDSTPRESLTNEDQDKALELINSGALAPYQLARIHTLLHWKAATTPTCYTEYPLLLNIANRRLAILTYKTSGLSEVLSMQKCKLLYDGDWDKAKQTLSNILKDVYSKDPDALIPIRLVYDRFLVATNHPATDIRQQDVKYLLSHLAHDGNKLATQPLSIGQNHPMPFSITDEQQFLLTELADASDIDCGTRTRCKSIIRLAAASPYATRILIAISHGMTATQFNRVLRQFTTYGIISLLAKQDLKTATYRRLSKRLNAEAPKPLDALAIA